MAKKSYLEIKEIKARADVLMEDILHPESVDALREAIIALKDFFSATEVKVVKAEDQGNYVKLKSDFWKNVDNKLISLLDKYRPHDFEDYYGKLETGGGIAGAIELLPDEYKNRPMLHILKTSQQQELWQTVIGQYEAAKKDIYKREKSYETFVELFSEDLRNRVHEANKEILRRKAEDREINALVTREMKKALDITRVVVTRMDGEVLVSYYYNNKGAQSKLSLPDIKAELMQIQKTAKFDYADLIRLSGGKE